MLLWIVLTIALIQLILIGSVVFLENRDSSKTIIWLLILFVLPVIGAIFYVIFGRRVYRRKLKRRKMVREYRLQKMLEDQLTNPDNSDEFMNMERPQQLKLVNVLLNLSSAPLTFNNQAEVLTNGDETFKALFQAMEEAQDHIHMEYFIFKYDEIGRQVLEILKRKASSGVKVRILVDGLGSLSITNRLHMLKKAGIEAHRFFPLKFPYISHRLNFRNHRKLVIVDGVQGFIGGINVGDEYLSRNKRYGFWRDTFLRLEGDSVHFLQTVFLSDWEFVSGDDIAGVEYFPQNKNLGITPVQIAASGPDSDRDTILHVYFAALTSAEKSIWIETPYFIPDESTMIALKTAAAANLDVRLVFQGVPDHKVTYWASHSYFEDLLEAGVRIYRYQKGILHAKILIVDGEIGCVGSTNFDLRSFSLNFEISAFIFDKAFSKRLEHDFLYDIEQSVEIKLEEFRQRPITQRIKESSARLFSPIL